MPTDADVTCTINNNDNAAHLTLVKTVTNDNGGTALPTAWTLAGAGPTSVSGSTGSPAVTNAIVNAGTYTLSEANGPAGYTAGNWSCTAGTLTGSSLVLPNGANATCTINNNDNAAHLTLVKTVTNDNGGTAKATDWTLTAAGPTPITGKTGDASITAAAVSAGTYTLSEAGGPGGYAASTWSCTAGTLTGSSLVLPNGTSATCTINNDDKPAKLTLVKTVTNDNGGTAKATDWTLTAAGPTAISGATGSTTVTKATVDAGKYDLSEGDGPTGYTPGDWDCGNATIDGSTVTVPTDADVTCTLNNDDDDAHLTLVKTVTNDNGGTAKATDWTLSADGPIEFSGVTGSTDVTHVAVDAGRYDLSEGGPTGYTPSDWDCGNATIDGSTVTVPTGADVTCTIDNNDQPAKLTLVKVVDAAASGSGKVPADWTLTAAPNSITGQGTVSGNGNPTTSGGVNQVSVFAGNYDLSESGPSGFDSGSWICQGGVVTGSAVAIPSGGNVICTITNTAISPTLTLIKTVTNNNGGTAKASDWTLTGAGPTPISGATGSPAVTNAPVKVGTYTLSESGPGGYTAGNWSCTGATITGATITLAEGHNVTCTINNDDNAAHLTLVKTVTNDNGGTAKATDWTLTAAGPTPITGTTGSTTVTKATVDAGTYTLSEGGGPTGYTPSDWDCGNATIDGSTVTVPTGADVTCTLNNNDQAAKLTLVKTVTNDNGGTAKATDWTLTAAGPTPITGTTGSTTVTKATVDAGTYTLSEGGGPTGYTPSDWDCGNATIDGSTVTVPTGADVTCTLNNNDQAAKLTLVKTVTNDNGGTAKATDWTLTAAGPTPITGTTGSTTVTKATVDAGTYDPLRGRRPHRLHPQRLGLRQRHHRRIHRHGAHRRRRHLHPQQR